MASHPVPGRDDKKLKDIDITKFVVKESKIKRVYEDDDFIIDICETREGPMVRISVFENGHWLDQNCVFKSDYLD